MLQLVRNDQDHVDLLFENPADARNRPVHDKIAELARKGMESPAALNSNEFKKICFALLVQYAQMGVGSTMQIGTRPHRAGS